MKVKIVHFHEQQGNRSEIYEVEGWDEAGKLAYIIEGCGCAVVSMKANIDSTPATESAEKTQRMIRLYDNEMYAKQLKEKYKR